MYLCRVFLNRRMAKKIIKTKNVAPKPKTAKKSASNSKFINPRTDFGFKKIFGNGVFLKNFLNNVLALDDKIVKLQYINVEYPGRINDNRSARFDLHCTTGKGEYIIT